MVFIKDKCVGIQIEIQLKNNHDNINNIKYVFVLFVFENVKKIKNLMINVVTIQTFPHLKMYRSNSQMNKKQTNK